MKAIILCAGKGERLLPLTKTIPKPMVPINNKPLLWYNIQLCKRYGIKDLAVNTSYLPEKIKEYFGNGEKFGVNLNYSFESELLGTSGALNNFKSFLNETFVVIYGDNITDLNLDKMLQFHKSKKTLATIFIFKETILDEKTTPGWVIFNQDSKVEEIIENPNEQDEKRLANKNKLTNGGIYILEPEIFKYIPKGFSDFAEDIFPKLIKEGKLYAFQTNCYFREVGIMKRYVLTKKEIESEQTKLAL